MLLEVLKCDRRGRFVAYKSVWPVQNTALPEPEFIESDIPFANVTDSEILDLYPYPRYDPPYYEREEYDVDEYPD
jgi:hypothetical protein